MSTFTTQDALLNKKIQFSREQLQYLERLFRPRAIVPGVSMDVIQYEAGQQSVIQAIAKAVP